MPTGNGNDGVLVRLWGQKGTRRGPPRGPEGDLEGTVKGTFAFSKGSRGLPFVSKPPRPFQMAKGTKGDLAVLKGDLAVLKGDPAVLEGDLGRGGGEQPDSEGDLDAIRRGAPRGVKGDVYDSQGRAPTPLSGPLSGPVSPPE